MKDLFVVYCTINQLNGRYYIGKSTQHRIDEGYLGSGPLIKAAIKKYGKKNFKAVILQTFETEQEAFCFEQYVLDEEKCFPINPLIYNVKPGGEGGSGGTVFLHRKGKMIKVVPEALDFYLKQGWKPGFSDTHRQHHREAQKKYVTVMTNGITNVRVTESEIADLEQQGFRKGIWQSRSDCSKEKASLSNSGRIHMHCEDRETAVKPEDVQKYVKQGWSIGIREKVRESRKYATSGKVWVHKESVEQRIFKDQVQPLLNRGWELGFSDAHRKANSLAQTGKRKQKPSPETREKIAAAHRGKKLSPEAIKKRTESRKRNREEKLKQLKLE